MSLDSATVAFINQTITTTLAKLQSTLTQTDVTTLEEYATSTFGLLPLRVAETLVNAGADSTIVIADLNNMLLLSSSVTASSFIILSGETFPGIELLGIPTGGAPSVDLEFAAIIDATETAIGQTGNLLGTGSAISDAIGSFPLSAAGMEATATPGSLSEAFNSLNAFVGTSNLLGGQTQISAAINFLNDNIGLTAETDLLNDGASIVVAIGTGVALTPVGLGTGSEKPSNIIDAVNSINGIIGSSTLTDIGLGTAVHYTTITQAINAINAVIGNSSISESSLSAAILFLQDQSLTIEHKIDNNGAFASIELLGSSTSGSATIDGEFTMLTTALADAIGQDDIGTTISAAILALQSQVGSASVSSTAYAGIELLDVTTSGSTSLSAEFTNLTTAIQTAIGTSALNAANYNGGISEAPTNIAQAINDINQMIGDVQLLDNYTGGQTISAVIGSTTIGLLGATGNTIAKAIGNTALLGVEENNIANAIGNNILLGSSGTSIATAIGAVALNAPDYNGSKSDAPANIAQAINDINQMIGDVQLLDNYTGGQTLSKVIGSSNIGLVGIVGNTIAAAIGITPVDNGVLGQTAPTNNLSAALYSTQTAIGLIALNAPDYNGTPSDAPANIVQAINDINQMIGDVQLLDNNDGNQTLSKVIGSTTNGLLGVAGNTIANAIGNTSLTEIKLLGSTTSAATSLSDELAVIITAIENAIGQTDIDGTISGVLASTSSSLTTLTSTVNNLSSTVSTLESDFTTLNSTVSSLSSSVSTLDSTVSSLSSSVSTLDSTVSSLSSSVSDLDTEVGTLDGIVGTIAIDLLGSTGLTVTKAIGSTTITGSTISNAINLLQSDVITLDSDIATLTSSISSLNSSVSTLDGEVSALTDIIGSSSITNVGSTITAAIGNTYIGNTLSSSISILQDKVNTLENDLATSPLILDTIGSTLRSTANLLGDDQTITSAIGNQAIAFNSLSAAVGSASLINSETSLSAAVLQNQKDIGNIAVSGHGTFYELQNTSPAVIAALLAKIFFDGFNYGSASDIASNIINMIATATTPALSYNTLLDDINNTLTANGNTGYPSTTTLIANALVSNLSLLSNSATAAEVASAIYSSQSTYVSGNGPIFGSSNHISDLETDLGNSLPSLLKLIGATNLSIGDNSLTGAIGDTPLDGTISAILASTVSSVSDLENEVNTLDGIVGTTAIDLLDSSAMTVTTAIGSTAISGGSLSAAVAALQSAGFVSSTAYAGIDLLGVTTSGSTSLSAQFTDINTAIQTAIGTADFNSVTYSGSSQTLPANIVTAINDINSFIGSTKVLSGPTSFASVAAAIGSTTGLLGSASESIATAIGTVSVGGSLSAILASTVSSVSTLSSDVSTLTSTVSTLNTDVTSLSSTITTIQDQIDNSASSSFAKIKILDVTTSGSDTISGEFTTVIGALETAIGNTVIDGTISAVLASTVSSILTLSTDLSTLDTDVTSLTATMGTTTDLLGSTDTTVTGAIGSSAINFSSLSVAIGDTAITGTSLTKAIKTLQNTVGTTSDLLGSTSITITEAIGSNLISNLADGTLSGAIGNNDISSLADGTLSGAIGTASLINFETSLSQAVLDNQVAIGNIGIQQNGPLFGYTVATPAVIATLLIRVFLVDFGDLEAAQVATNIVNIINSYEITLSEQTLLDDINNTISNSATTGYPSTTGAIISQLEENLQNLSNTATAAEVAAAIYSTSSTYVSGAGPIKGTQSHVNDLETDLGRSHQSILKLIGGTDVTIADGSLSGAIGTGTFANSEDTITSVIGANAINIGDGTLTGAIGSSAINFDSLSDAIGDIPITGTSLTDAIVILQEFVGTTSNLIGDNFSITDAIGTNRIVFGSLSHAIGSTTISGTSITNAIYTLQNDATTLQAYIGNQAENADLLGSTTMTVTEAIGTASLINFETSLSQAVLDNQVTIGNIGIQQNGLILGHTLATPAVIATLLIKVFDIDFGDLEAAQVATNIINIINSYDITLSEQTLLDDINNTISNSATTGYPSTTGAIISQLKENLQNLSNTATAAQVAAAIYSTSSTYVANSGPIKGTNAHINDLETDLGQSNQSILKLIGGTDVTIADGSLTGAIGTGTFANAGDTITSVIGSDSISNLAASITAALGNGAIAFNSLSDAIGDTTITGDSITSAIYTLQSTIGTTTDLLGSTTMTVTDAIGSSTIKFDSLSEAIGDDGIGNIATSITAAIGNRNIAFDTLSGAIGSTVIQSPGDGSITALIGPYDIFYGIDGTITGTIGTGDISSIASTVTDAIVALKTDTTPGTAGLNNWANPKDITSYTATYATYQFNVCDVTGVLSGTQRVSGFYGVEPTTSYLMTSYALCAQWAFSGVGYSDSDMDNIGYQIGGTDGTCTTIVHEGDDFLTPGDLLTVCMWGVYH